MGMDSAGRERPGQASPFPGLRGGMGGMLAMVVLVGLGEKMAERFLPLYLLALGAALREAGAHA